MKSGSAKAFATLEKLPHRPDVAYAIHSYMIGNGIDATISQIASIKNNKAVSSDKLTSNRRNNFDE
jgi:hypothetical protein